ncbi:MAG: ATP-binding cassette domain-containing protein [bacterium]|nr:ATP-binding cassette domain-containing protein [bacterium]
MNRTNSSNTSDRTATDGAAPHDRDAAISVRGLRHSFGVGATSVRVLHDVNLDIKRGEFVILMGPSGSGKTTLLTLVGCLRSVQSGSVRLLGQELLEAPDPTLVAMRRRVGFIFQAHNLHDSLTAVQNVRMGLAVHGSKATRNWRQACEHALELVGLEDRMQFLPEKLSGGQKQRVAISRAIVGNPEVIFADEPTAALDKESGERSIEILRRLADERGTAILVVTHDHRILDYADRIVQMEDGRIVDQ